MYHLSTRWTVAAAGGERCERGTEARVWSGCVINTHTTYICAPITLHAKHRRQDTMQGLRASCDGIMCVYLALRRGSALLWPRRPHRWCDCIAVHCHGCVDVRFHNTFSHLQHTTQVALSDGWYSQRFSQPTPTDPSQPRHGMHSANRPATKRCGCRQASTPKTSLSVRQS